VTIMGPYISDDKLLHCTCGSTNLVAARAKVGVQFSILCKDCTEKKQKNQHVCGFGLVEELVERDFNLSGDDEKVKEITLNIFKEQLGLEVDCDKVKLSNINKEY